VQYCKIYTGRKLKIAHHQIYIMWGGGDKAHKNNNVPMYSIRKITFTNMKEHTYVINFKLKEGSERKSKY
jgi:hypothetical protein